MLGAHVTLQALKQRLLGLASRTNTSTDAWEVHIHDDDIYWIEAKVNCQDTADTPYEQPCAREQHHC
jgi:hypothetical protein